MAEMSRVSNMFSRNDQYQARVALELGQILNTTKHTCLLHLSDCRSILICSMTARQACIMPCVAQGVPVPARGFGVQVEVYKRGPAKPQMYRIAGPCQSWSIPDDKKQSAAGGLAS